jgi:predicted Zn-dependent peptidase
MRRRSDALPGSTLLAALVLALAPAAQAPVTFTSPDGSRFVLVPDPAMTAVHWAVATLADATDEPAGFEGLAMATARASLGGTWTTGSSDAAGEQQALAALDQAWADLLRTPGEEARLRVRERQAAAQLLGDDTTFVRVLAALPAYDPEVVERSPVCLFQLTTLPPAIGAIGARLVDRREQQALRKLPESWMQEIVRRQVAFDQNPLAGMRAELLALALPNHPASRAVERPWRMSARRDQAMAVWQATQHPTRTVHVLLGGFDPRAARTALTAVFDKTQLPQPAPAPFAEPRPMQSMRRSTVPGTAQPTVAIAWILPAIQDPFVLELAARWFGDGEQSWLGRQLQANGRKRSVVRCQAPWPETVGGRSLMLVEVVDPAGLDQLTDQILAACKSATAKEPAAADLQPALTDLQREWTTVTNDPRRYAAEIARAALLWPGLPPRIGRPPKIEPRAVHAVLSAVFAGQPVVVEGRP